MLLKKRGTGTDRGCMDLWIVVLYIVHDEYRVAYSLVCI
jgi:hypothetical protein